MKLRELSTLEIELLSSLYTLDGEIPSIDKNYLSETCNAIIESFRSNPRQKLNGIAAWSELTEFYNKIISTTVVRSTDIIIGMLRDKYKNQLFDSAWVQFKHGKIKIHDCIERLSRIENSETDIEFVDNYDPRLYIKPLQTDQNLPMDSRYGFEDVFFYRGFINTIGGYSGSGKTTLLLNFILDYLLKGERILFFTLEMPFGSIIKRLFIIYLNRFYGYRTSYSREISDEFIDKYIAEFEKLTARLAIVDRRVITAERICGIIQSYIYHRKSKPIVCIDYLQIITNENSDIRMGIIETVRKLSAIARDRQLVLLLLAQTNRESRKLNYTSDTYSDTTSLQESAAIEQESAMVMLLDRYLDRETGKLNEYASLNIGKNRFGSPQRQLVRWNNDTGYIPLYLSESELEYFGITGNLKTNTNSKKTEGKRGLRRV